jgi:methyl-accepting chemotaxis protein
VATSENPGVSFPEPIPPVDGAAGADRPPPADVHPRPVASEGALGPALAEKLEVRRRRVAWLPLVAAAGLMSVGWLAVPFLFLRDPEIVRALQGFYVLLCLQAMASLLAVTIFGAGGLASTVRFVAEGRLPDAATVAVASRTAVRLPVRIGTVFVVQSLVLASATSLRGYIVHEVPWDVVVFASLFGFALGVFGASLMGALIRLDLALFTRVLSEAGVVSWPGRKHRFTRKIAMLCGLVALIPALLSGAVGYHYGDRLFSDQLGSDLARRIGPAVEASSPGGLEAGGEAATVRRLRSIGAALHPSAEVALTRDGALILSTHGEMERLLGLRGLATPEGGHLIDPARGCVIAFSPVLSEGERLLLRVPRAVVAETLGPMQSTIGGLIVFTMVLSILLGWASARSMEAPLSDMARITTRVARGDLRDPGGRILTDDAFGEVAGEVAHMRARLAGTVERVVGLSERVGGSVQGTIDQAQRIGDGAKAQVSATSAVVEANEAVDGGLRSVSEMVRRVAQGFREATVSGAEVGREFEELAGDVEALAHETTEAARAVAELSRETESVAGEVAGLSDAADRATRAMGEVDTALGRMREHARGGAEAAQRTIAAAKDGAESVRLTVAGIGRIREGSEQAVARVEDLSRRISEVDRVLAVIDDIAEKTNLLALNASIIAAQAGEQGRSFAVVAGEIRDLATRTATSTREIATTVEDVREASRDAVGVIRAGGSRVEEGVTLAGSAERALEEIVGTAYEASAAAGEIATVTDLQARNVSHVSQEIDQVAGMAARIARAGEVQASSAAGARRAVERIASLTRQVNQAVAALIGRNGRLLATFAKMNEHVGEVDRTLETQALAMTAVVEETTRIRDVAQANAERAERLEAAARILDGAADALASEVRAFRLR